MKKKFRVFSLIASVVIVSACGDTRQEQGNGLVVDELTPIEVELNIPDEADIGESVILSSTVTQDDNIVDDASEVVYEIWLEGQKEQSELIEAEEQDGHIYLLKYTFEDSGLYHVQVHITARGLHRMPTAHIQVGATEEFGYEIEETHEHQLKHEHASVLVDSVIKEGRLVLNLLIDETPFSDGTVTLELWEKEGDGQRQWLDLTEVAEGQFELLNNLTDGLYLAVVHIKDENLHEHINIEFEIQ